MPRTPPGTRADYRAFVTIQTRWSDNDEYGHMNNAAYLQIFDTGISRWQMAQGIVLRGPGAIRIVVVETGCRYHAELGFPDPIDVGIRVGHLGRSSVRFEVGLFRGDDDAASAEGHFAQVLTDAAGAPTPIDGDLRAIFAAIATA